MPINLQKLSLPKLERLALDLHEDYRRAKRNIAQNLHPADPALLRRIKNAPALFDILHERQLRLNRRFKFTPETTARFVAINDLLQGSLAKARREARRILPGLRRRIAANDAFLTDYEFEIQLQPYIGKPDGIYPLLESITHESSAHLHRWDCDLHPDPGGVEIENWNQCEALARHASLKPHTIGYAMHELSSHTFWSLPDILQINDVWTDVVITRQHHAKLPLINLPRVDYDRK